MSIIKFPDTFLYSVSWEDPKVDEEILDIQTTDTVLTITGGGDNVFNYIINGAQTVHCVDLNPAQYHLMELKIMLLRNSIYQRLWNMFGEGIEQDQDYINNALSLHTSYSTCNFWLDKKHYFNSNIYFQGAMGYIVKFAHMLNLRKAFTNDLVSKSSILWKLSYYMLNIFLFFFVTIFQHTSVLWSVCGTPKPQIKMITNHDNRSLYEYIHASLKPVFYNSDLIHDNYFYYLIFNGKFTKDNCPEYLKQKHFNFLKSAVYKIKNINGSLIDELNNNSFDKVILMDHMDWMDEKYINALCSALDRSLSENGKVIFRSASLHPWFVDIFVKQYNFVATQISCHSKDNLMDRVNMYASFWVVTRK